MKYLILTFLFLMSGFANADDNDDIDALAQPVLKLFEQGEVSKVASRAITDSILLSYIGPTVLNQADINIEEKIKQLGKFRSSKLVHQQGIEGIYLIRWYVLVFDRQPSFLRLEFYKAENDWRIDSVGIDLDLSDFLKSGGENELRKLGIQ